MSNDLIDIAWEVRENGYKWMKARKGKNFGFDPEEKKSTYLLPAKAVDWVTMYSPLDQQHSALFLAFSATEPTEEAIIPFANVYGLLTDEESLIIPADEYGIAPVILAKLDPTSDVTRWVQVRGDSLKTWQSEIMEIRRAVSLWDAIGGRNGAQLPNHISWANKDTIQCQFEDGSFYSHMVDWDSGGVAAFMRHGDLHVPARYFLHLMVNKRLIEHTSTRLLLNERGVSELHIVPHNLLGALWLQLASAASGNKEFKGCPECAKFYEISPETARKSRRYCSNACRFKAYRGRQERARHLYDEGIPIGDISLELDSDVKTITGWVKK